MAQLKIKPGKEQEFLMFSGQGPDQVPGIVFEHIDKLDGSDNEYILAVGFESEDTYTSNANSPEQHQRYFEYREMLEADPEWNDSEVVQSQTQ